METSTDLKTTLAELKKAKTCLKQKIAQTEESKQLSVLNKKIASIVKELTTKKDDDKSLKNMVYWEIDSENGRNDFFFNGLITREQYEKIKTLDKKTELFFPEYSKHFNPECYLEEIEFIEDVDERLYCKAEDSHSSFDLMDIMEQFFENN